MNNNSAICYFLLTSVLNDPFASHSLFNGANVTVYLAAGFNS